MWIVDSYINAADRLPCLPQTGLLQSCVHVAFLCSLSEQQYVWWPDVIFNTVGNKSKSWNKMVHFNESSHRKAHTWGPWFIHNKNKMGILTGTVVACQPICESFVVSLNCFYSAQVQAQCKITGMLYKLAIQWITHKLTWALVFSLVNRS